MSFDRDDSEVMDAEIVQGQLQAAQQLPADLMLLKLENESIMSIAAAKPRDPAKLVKQLQALIDSYPASADEAIYSKPVGKIKRLVCGECKAVDEVSNTWQWACPKCQSQRIGEQKEVMKFAEGLSIRAAESIRSVFGYTRLSVTMEDLPNGAVKIRGVMVDYSAGNITADERIVTPIMRKKNGETYRIPEDRFLNVVVKAEKAKLRRDIILDSVPNIVKAAFQDACEAKLTSLVDATGIEKRVLPWFADKGISQDAVERIVGRKLAMGWTQQDVLKLKKIKNALESGETTVQELLQPVDEPAEPAAQTSAPSSIEQRLAAAAVTQAANGNGHSNGNGPAAAAAPTVPAPQTPPTPPQTPPPAAAAEPQPPKPESPKPETTKPKPRQMREW